MRHHWYAARFTLVALLATLAFLSVSSDSFAQDRMVGDINGSNTTDISDAILSLQHIVGLHVIPETDFRYADVSPRNTDGTFGDGSVRIDDTVSLLRRIVNLEDPLTWPGFRYFRFPPPLAGSVQVTLPDTAMFVGSWHYAPIQIDTASGLTLDDLEFMVDGGLKGGLVSPSLDSSFDPEKPQVLFGAGFQPGDYTLKIVKKGTDTLLGETLFGVTDIWKDSRTGPSYWFHDSPTDIVMGSAWGGGPSSPQNINVVPASGTQRVALVLIDTNSQRYSSDDAVVQGHKDRWLNEMVNGVDEGGVIRSVKKFYQEASFNQLDFTASVFGPVQMPDAYGDYFNDDGAPIGDFWQSAVTAADSVVNYNNFDTVVFISQEVTGPPLQRAWPYGGRNNFTTAEGNKNLGVVSMPNIWGTTNTREIYDTLSHEIGHTLRLADQYTPAVAGRNTGFWEMMDWDGELPHFSIVHRMMLGWIQPTWIRNFNFASLGVPVDETVTLSPVELGAPPAGRFAGIEIRVADGWNYYLEYRKAQAAQIGDQGIPADSRVLGTDVVTPPFTAPFSRPQILLLRNDPDGDGPVLDNGGDYEEVDTTDPTYPTDFKIEVSGIDGNKADVRIKYGINSKPDPLLRTWPSPTGQWQSPDIEVRNARNLADPANWYNVPWAGQPNEVIAKVKNNGNLAAPGVKVDFFVKDFTVGGAPETAIGSDTQDIPANGTVEFKTGWVPPISGTEGHYCVVARIPIYFVPGTAPPVLEMSATNNEAQSNYTRFISQSASPPTREVTEMSVGNPFDKAALVYIISNQTNPLYRTYVQHSWLVLEPKEVRKIKVMFEYAGDDYLKRAEEAKDQEAMANWRKMRQIPNRVGFRGEIENPLDFPRHSIETLGGAEAEIAHGLKTRIQDFFAVDTGQGNTRTGGMVTLADGKTPVPAGKVLLAFTFKGRNENTPLYRYETLEVAQGTFGNTFKFGGWLTAQAFYLPPANYGDAASPIIQNTSQQ